MRLPVLALLTALYLGVPAFAQPDIPDGEVPVQFHGRLVGEFLDDGRRIKLLMPYSYTDPAGETWTVPAETIVDGASIPQPFWSVIGGPLEGRYRNASVVHDFYCDEKTRPWQAVHRVFFDAMLESGVDELQAKVMYYAVYMFGPRWEMVESRGVSLECADGSCTSAITPKQILLDLPPPPFSGPEVEADIQTILDTDPDLATIEALAETN
jgi:hypothetical protein